MNFIDQIVVPPSANHILLLRYIFIVSLLIFLPYLGMMMGASFISVYFNRKENSMLSRFAKDVIEKLAITKNAELGLGIIPLFSILFIYAQLLYQANTITVSILSLSVILFIAAFISIYKYRSGFEIESVIKSLKNSGSKENKEAAEFEERLVRNSSASGKIGTTLLYIAAYLFVGSMALASSPDRWADVNNILQVLFSGATIFNFVFLLALAGTLSGAAILFYFFKWPASGTGKQGGLNDMDEEYSAFVKHFGINLAFISSIALPVLMFFSFLFLPENALSNDVFLFIILLIAAALVLSNVLYMMYKNSETSYAVPVFFFVLVIFAFNIFKEESVLGNALQKQSYTVIQKSDEFEKEVKSKLVTTSGISGKDIYNTKCIACHRFDVKLVGPPYQETVPKYNGDVQKLADFVFSPTQNNPGYPPMPNQGLKKKEAVAVAKFLIDSVAATQKK
jgi:cytochrome c